jgi:uncharacterized damage-inducible protein DinB
MKAYLLDTFRYNDWANKQVITAINTLPEKEEALKLMSHLVTAQDKWFNRIVKETDDQLLTWFGPVFPEKELTYRWEQSVSRWIRFIEDQTEQELEKDIEFIRQSDGKMIRVSIKDVILQLNYHSIHHRAQLNSILSKQGIKPPATDYIFTAMEEVS